MNLEELNKRISTATARASDINRQMAFAGFAAIWLLKYSDIIPPQLHRAIIFLVFSLLGDILQYMYYTFLWQVVYLRKEKELNYNKEVQFYIPFWTRLPGTFLFWGKILSTGVAYIIIGAYVAKKYM